MEQFERYSEAIGCNEIDCSDYDVRCTGLSCRDCQTIRKAAWKAALEWIKDKDAEQVRGIIEEELSC